MLPGDRLKDGTNRACFGYPLQRAVFIHLLAIRGGVWFDQVLRGLVVKSSLLTNRAVPEAAHGISALAGIWQIAGARPAQVVINHRLDQVVTQRARLYGHCLQCAAQPVHINTAGLDIARTQAI